MTHELVYTSAPRGLRPGSIGYCTVAQTDGIPQALAERLELLSAYRHLRVGADPDANGNPVVYAHAVASAGGRTYHVLSRIADSGLDYSGRNNYLAHHVALTADELPRAGPAAACESWPFETAWDGVVGSLPANRAAPGESADVQKCARWEDATGDAGWAGVLAGATAGEPAYLIFRPDQDVLGLIAEAMTLIPPEERWRVTFSTYFTKSGGAECQWRCVPAGSAEAKAAIGARRGVVLRLDRDTPGDEPPAGGLVDAARTGVLPPRRARPERVADTPSARPMRVPAFDTPPDDFDDAEADAEVTDPVAPRARPAARPLPAPPTPSRGLGQLLLGLAMGLLLAVLAVALVEVGAKASPLRLAGVKGKYEEELGDKLASSEKDVKAAKDQAQAAEKLIDSKDKIVADWQKDVRTAEKQRDAAQDAAEKWRTKAGEEESARIKAEQQRNHWKKEAEQAKKNAPDPGGGQWAALFKLKAAVERNAELEKQLQAANAELEGQSKRGPAAPPVSVGVPFKLAKDERTRSLFAVAVPPGGKATINVLGLPAGMGAAPIGDKVTVTGPGGYSADLRIDKGVVTVTGTQLDTRPLLGLGVIQVTGAGPDEYHHLTTADLKVEGKLSPPGVGDKALKYRSTASLYDLLKGDLVREYRSGVEQGQIKLGTTARVGIKGKDDKEYKEYVLGPDPEKEDGKDKPYTLVLQQPNAGENEPTALALALDKQGALVLNVEYARAGAGDNLECRVLAAELVRHVEHNGGAIRQELVRIR